MSVPSTTTEEQHCDKSKSETPLAELDSEVDADERDHSESDSDSDSSLEDEVGEVPPQAKDQGKLSFNLTL